MSYGYQADLSCIQELSKSYDKATKTITELKSQNQVRVMSSGYQADLFAFRNFRHLMTRLRKPSRSWRLKIRLVSGRGIEFVNSVWIAQALKNASVGHLADIVQLLRIIEVCTEPIIFSWSDVYWTWLCKWLVLVSFCKSYDVFRSRQIMLTQRFWYLSYSRNWVKCAW